MQARKEKVQRHYPILFNEVNRILFEFDPMRINRGHNIKEYEFEVTTILPRLSIANSEAEALQIIHEEFQYWFGGNVVGEPERYAQVAEQIWKVWLQNQALN